MKKIILPVMAVLALVSCNKGEKGTQGSSTFNGLVTTADSVSYFIGTSVAENMKRGGLDTKFSEAAYLEGMRNVFNGDSIILQPQIGGAIANRLAMESQKAQIEAEKEKFTDKIKAGEDFLNAKSLEEEVVTLPSGLRYKILKEGNGEKPVATDMVTTHYHGTLLDGTVFDSSVDRGEPAKFPVNGVIPAWIEALQLMPTGSKWELYVPYKLAYGERGAGGKIGPYETLIFQVELISIDK